MTLEQIEQYARTLMTIFLLLPIVLSAFVIRSVMREISKIQTIAITYRETRIVYCKIIILLIVAMCIATCHWATQIPSWLIPAVEHEMTIVTSTKVL